MDDREHGGSGNVNGPGSSTAGNLAMFADSTGKVLLDGGKPLPTGTIAGTSDTQIFTNKTISGTSNTLSNISLTSAVTGVLQAPNGGTGNGFTLFAGPSVTTKLFTLPDASATILTDLMPVTAIQGGTGQNTYLKGDLLVATNPTSLGKVHLGTDGQMLTADSTQSNGVKWTTLNIGIFGNVNGPSGSAPGNISTFADGTGKLLLDSGRSLPIGTIAGTSDTQILTNKTISGTSNILSNISLIMRSREFCKRQTVEPGTVSHSLQDHRLRQRYSPCQMHRRRS